MSGRPFPGLIGRVLHAALDRLSLHHISHQAARRGFMLADDEPDEDGSSGDDDMLDEAEACFRRGDVAEALVWLERALPDTFAGLATVAVPRFPQPTGRP